MDESISSIWIIINQVISVGDKVTYRPSELMSVTPFQPLAWLLELSMLTRSVRSVCWSWTKISYSSLISSSNQLEVTVLSGFFSLTGFYIQPPTKKAINITNTKIGFHIVFSLVFLVLCFEWGSSIWLWKQLIPAWLSRTRVIFCAGFNNCLVP